MQLHPQRSGWQVRGPGALSLALSSAGGLSAGRVGLSVVGWSRRSTGGPRLNSRKKSQCEHEPFASRPARHLFPRSRASRRRCRGTCRYPVENFPQVNGHVRRALLVTPTTLVNFLSRVRSASLFAFRSLILLDPLTPSSGAAGAASGARGHGRCVASLPGIPAPDRCNASMPDTSALHRCPGSVPGIPGRRCLRRSYAPR